MTASHPRQRHRHMQVYILHGLPVNFIGANENEGSSRSSRVPRKPVASRTDDTKVNWSMVRSHMPPWMNFDSKMPMLCHQFKLRIELSGKGHVERTPRVTATTAYCALFKNMLVFCQATFVAEDETAPQSPSDATSLGFVFLHNLDVEALNQKLSQGKRRTSSATMSFVVTLGPYDSLTFILPLYEVYLFEAWQESLRQCLSPRSNAETGDHPAFIQVRCSRFQLI